MFDDVEQEAVTLFNAPFSLASVCLCVSTLRLRLIISRLFLALTVDVPSDCLFRVILSLSDIVNQGLNEM